MREANQILNDTLLNDLSFFFNLCPERPTTTSIRYDKDAEQSHDEVEVQVLGHSLR